MCLVKDVNGWVGGKWAFFYGVWRGDGASCIDTPFCIRWRLDELRRGAETAGLESL